LSLLKTGLRSRSRVGAALKRPALGFSIAIGVIMMIGTSGRIALGSSSRPLIGAHCRLARGDFFDDRGVLSGVSGHHRHDEPATHFKLLNQRRR